MKHLIISLFAALFVAFVIVGCCCTAKCDKDCKDGTCSVKCEQICKKKCAVDGKCSKDCKEACAKAGCCTDCGNGKCAITPAAPAAK